MFNEAVNTFKKEFKTLTTQDKDMIEKSASLIVYFFQEYLNRWWSIDSKRHWVKIEDKFSVPFKMSDGETVYLTGTYDGAYKSKTSDELWLFETKNKRTWDSEKLSCILPYDIQVAIYLTALKRCEKMFPVGCDYNILKRPGEKIRKNESIKAFAERVSDAMRADPSKYFERINMKFTRSELLTMEERTVALVTEYYHWWTAVLFGDEARRYSNTATNIQDIRASTNVTQLDERLSCFETANMFRETYLSRKVKEGRWIRHTPSFDSFIRQRFAYASHADLSIARPNLLPRTNRPK